MKISSVKIHKFEKQENSRLLGVASVLIDDSFAVHNIRIIEGDNGLFIAMPSRKTNEDTFKDICHPINPETRSLFEKAIFDEFEKSE